MRVRTTAVGRQRGEAGTASLEALLCLPFVFLIAALVLDVGYGWVVRARAEAAVRYAAESYAQVLGEGADPAAAARATEAALRSAYYPDGTAFELAAGGQGADLAGEMRRQGGELPGGAVSGALVGLGSSLSGRHQLRLTVPRHVPTRTLLPDTPVQVAFALDGTTWTHDEVPLGLDGLTGAGSRSEINAFKLFGWVAQRLFWLVGMEA